MCDIEQHFKQLHNNRCCLCSLGEDQTAKTNKTSCLCSLNRAQISSSAKVDRVVDSHPKDCDANDLLCLRNIQRQAETDNVFQITEENELPGYFKGDAQILGQTIS